MATPIHSKIIEQAAKKVLKPAGLKQKGRSQSWLDDHGWFTIMVEFQPLSGHTATGLNVGIGFNWYPKEYFSFDIGYRAHDFIFFESEEQFVLAMEKLADLALKKVQGYQEALQHLESARNLILKHTFTSEELWGSYHKGVICGLTADPTAAIRYFNRLQSQNLSAAFEQKLAETARILSERAHDAEFFKLTILELIAKNRALKHLEPLIKTDFWAE